MTSINRLRIVLLCLAILGVAVTLAAISQAQTPDYQWQLKLAEAEQATVDHVPDTGQMVATPTTGTTPAATAPARKPATLVAPAESIHWVTPAQAKASPRPDYWCVTTDDRSCVPCLRLKSLLTDRKVVAWSRHFDCVKSDRYQGRLPAGYPVQYWRGVQRTGCDVDYTANDLAWDFANAYQPKSIKVATKRAWPNYHERDYRHWSYPGNIYTHLIREHSRQIDPNWIRSLSLDAAKTLHDDLHDGNADWSRIVRR